MSCLWTALLLTPSPSTTACPGDAHLRVRRRATLLLALGAGALMLCSVGVMMRRATRDAAGEPKATARRGASASKPIQLDKAALSFPEALLDAPSAATATTLTASSSHIAPPGVTVSGLDDAPSVLPAVFRAEQVVLGRPGRGARSSSPNVQLVPRGHAGAYVLQVLSFPTRAQAVAFETLLRQRGHGAFTVSVEVKERGLSHRVQIGPFRGELHAEAYRKRFEAREDMVAHVLRVDRDR
ncbi:MAG: SPOR domain-containing protein [Polyangiales bacterium]